MLNKNETYGVNKANKNFNSLDCYIEEILHNGYVIIDSGYSLEKIKTISKKLDNVYKIQSNEFGGENNLILINDSNVVRCPLVYDSDFLQISTCPILMQIAERILGDNFVLIMQNGIINKPDNLHYQTKWHRDLNYQHWTSSRPLAISALLCIDDFTSSNGGTHIIPGSHLKEKFPSDEYIKNHEIILNVKAGSFLIMDSMLFHCAGNNQSNHFRRGLNHVIGVPILAQQINIPHILQGKYVEDEFLEKYLGYRWQPKSSVKEWRFERLRMLK